MLCPPDTGEGIDALIASFDTGTFIFFSDGLCCPDARKFYCRDMATADYVAAGTRTNVWMGPGADPPEFLLPVATFHLAAVVTGLGVGMGHCRKDGLTGFFVEGDEPLADVAAVASIVNQADVDDASKIAEFQIVYSGGGNNWSGSSVFTWIDPLGREATITISNNHGVAPGDWGPFEFALCEATGDGAESFVICRVTNGFLFKVMKEDLSKKTIAAPSMDSNDMTSNTWIRGTNATGCVVTLYKHYDTFIPADMPGFPDGSPTDPLGDIWAQYPVLKETDEAGSINVTINLDFPVNPVTGTTDDYTQSGSIKIEAA